MPSLDDLVREYLNELMRFTSVLWYVSDAYERVIGWECGGYIGRVGTSFIGGGDPITYGLLGVQPGLEARGWVWVREGDIWVGVDEACTKDKCVAYGYAGVPLPKNVAGLLVLYPIARGTKMWGSIRGICGPYADVAAWVFNHPRPIGPLKVDWPLPSNGSITGFLRIGGDVGVIKLVESMGRTFWELYINGHTLKPDRVAPGVREALAEYLVGRTRAIRRGIDIILGLGGLLGVL